MQMFMGWSSEVKKKNVLGLYCLYCREARRNPFIFVLFVYFLLTFQVLPEVIRDMGMIHCVNESRLKTPTVHFTDLYTCHRRVLS